ncbi:uncharacterized protein LOC130787262 [Actinidia eriantha]|uniref:uncharacterized protein LOC130787262 n=1 Tax=Actinidia eriantha TaxID=165200 RepID=UPI00258D432B|nr:uncharacterized protein LOC130787262 [Actinidia eriantha]
MRWHWCVIASQICQKLQNLARSQEYGGDEGWTFIEDVYYTVLIESLLNEQEEEANKEKRTIGQNELEDTVGAIGSEHSDSGRLGQHFIPLSSIHDPLPTVTHRPAKHP